VLLAVTETARTVFITFAEMLWSLQKSFIDAFDGFGNLRKCISDTGSFLEKEL
jgi:hypothetical protein